MSGPKRLILLLAIIPLSLAVKASGGTDKKGSEPALYGFVTDADSKKPVQGVTVSISSGKGQEKKDVTTVTTDAAGNFKVPQIPTGGVTITLEKKGYKTYRKENIIIKEGVPLKLSFDIDQQDTDSDDMFHPVLRMLEGM